MHFIYFISPASAGAAIEAYKQSDSVGQFIVWLLFLGSILTWTIMVEKAFFLRRAKRASLDFIRMFRDEKYPIRLLSRAEKTLSPIASVYKNGSANLLDYYDIPAEFADQYASSKYPQKKLSTAEVETLRSSLERAVADQILQIEDKIGLLATAVSVSPFFGLFGTVWGVMMAFCGMATQGNAGISAIAPGVSGALLTTVVGLMVAIPSLIGYNLLTNTIRQITVYMDNFVEEYMAKIKLEQHDIS
jgi:biopolymer transport protein TolQ